MPNRSSPTPRSERSTLVLRPREIRATGWPARYLALALAILVIALASRQCSSKREGASLRSVGAGLLREMLAQ